MLEIRARGLRLGASDLKAFGLGLCFVSMDNESQLELAFHHLELWPHQLEFLFPPARIGVPPVRIQVPLGRVAVPHVAIG